MQTFGPLLLKGNNEYEYEIFIARISQGYIKVHKYT